MKVRGPADLGGAEPVRGAKPSHARAVEGTRPVSRPDTVEISEMARFLEKLARLPEIRQDKVDAVKRQIAEGRYLTPDKLDKAIDNLLADLL